MIEGGSSISGAPTIYSLSLAFLILVHKMRKFETLSAFKMLESLANDRHIFLFYGLAERCVPNL